ncbi:MAG: LON peptidase substrate-binding domain-containing protein [Dehalococcoidia bacterium]|nr:LON peptidase substrate-binding domain-containing protein [Dehalococcoidia bacterium]
MTERLRLFPLRTVLFPGMALSLQVFEERYRTLVAECLDSRAPFGVVLIREGNEVGGGPVVPHNIGATARLERVAPTRDGRLAVQVVGVRRFRILETLEGEPYLSARVEYPVDQAAEVSAELLQETRERYRQLQRLRHTIANEYHRHVEAPETPGALADAIGGVSRGLATERTLQRVLAALSVRKRLDLASEVLAGAITATHQQAQAVVAQRWARVERRN